MVTEVAAEVVKMVVVLAENSKETEMPASAVKVVGNVVKVDLEVKAADNVVKVAQEVKVVLKKRADLREKVAASDVKAGSKKKVDQVLLTVNHHSEDHLRKNHNQFKESIS